MPNRTLALDVHGEALRAVVFESSFRSYELVSHAREEREPAVPLGEQIRRFLDTNGLAGDSVISVLPPGAAAFRILDLPFRDRRRLQQTVPFELEAHMPLALEEGIVDFQVLLRQGDGARVFAAYAPEETVAEHLETLAAAGIEPERVGFAPLAATNVLTLFDGDRPQRFAFLHLDGGHASLALYRDGTLEVLRVADTGDPAGPEAVAREVGWTIRSLVESEEDSSRLPLLVGGTVPEGLESLLVERLPVEIQRLEDLPLRHVPESLRKEQGTYAPTIGAALREISDFPTVGVDFRQGAFAHQRSNQELRDRFGSLAALAASVFFLFLVAEGVAFYSLSSRAEDTKERVREVFVQTLPSERMIVDETAQLSQAIADLRERREQLGVPSGGSVSLLDVLREISSRAPRNPRMDVGELDLDPGVVRLSVETSSFEAVEAIKQSLSASPLFREVEVKDPRTTPKGQVSFRLGVYFGRESGA